MLSRIWNLELWLWEEEAKRKLHVKKSTSFEDLIIVFQVKMSQGYYWKLKEGRSSFRCNQTVPPSHQSPGCCSGFVKGQSWRPFSIATSDEHERALQRQGSSAHCATKPLVFEQKGIDQKKPERRKLPPINPFYASLMSNWFPFDVWSPGRHGFLKGP